MLADKLFTIEGMCAITAVITVGAICIAYVYREKKSKLESGLVVPSKDSEAVSEGEQSKEKSHIRKGLIYNELRETEQNYLKIMKALLDDKEWIIAQCPKKTTYEDEITKAEATALFNKLEELKFHQDKMSEALQTYTPKLWTQALQELYQVYGEYSVLHTKYVAKQIPKETGDEFFRKHKFKLDIPTALIAPIQRAGRYHLLAKELMKTEEDPAMLMSITEFNRVAETFPKYTNFYVKKNSSRNEEEKSRNVLMKYSQEKFESFVSKVTNASPLARKRKTPISS